MSTQKIDFDELEALGVAAFAVCDSYEQDTLRTGIDLDRQTEQSLVAILRGEPLERVLGFVDARHPAAALVADELTTAYRRFQDDDMEPSKAAYYFGCGDMERGTDYADFAREQWMIDFFDLLTRPSGLLGTTEALVRGRELLEQGESTTGYSRRLCEPWKTYERLLHAEEQIVKGSAESTLQVLGDVPPGPPMQKALWALAYLEAKSRLQDPSWGVSATILAAYVDNAVELMADTTPFVDLLKERHPLQPLLAAHAFGAPSILVQAAADVPLLLGAELLIGSERHSLALGSAAPDYAVALFELSMNAPDYVVVRLRPGDNPRNYELRLAELELNALHVISLPELYYTYRRLAAADQGPGFAKAADALLELSPALKAFVDAAA